MGKLVKTTLLAFLAAGIMFRPAQAANTKFTDVQVRNLTVTGTQTNTGNVTDSGNHTVTGNLSVTGTSTLTGAVTQSSTTMSGLLLPWPLTLAQINALTSSATGQMAVCTNCTMTKVCVSSGTTATYQWTVMQGTASATAPLHCQ